MKMQERAALAAAVLTATFLALGPTRSAASEGDWRPDAWVTTKAKIALMTSAQVSAMDVDVDTTDGNVTLHGTVGSEAARDAAAKEVREILGVRSVRNLLQIVPPTEQSDVRKEDDQIRAAVSTALDESPQLSNSDIEVQSVNSGVVLLGGEADDLEDRLIAIRVSRGVDGVARVESEITGPEELRSEGDLEKSAKQTLEKTKGVARSAGDSVQSAGETTAQALSDTWITTKAKSILAADADTPFTTVNVDTVDGRVTLFGSTETADQKAAVEREVRAVDGVKSVRNLLQVVPPKDAKEVARTDETIDEQVENRLQERPQFEKADIDVDVVDRVVRLTGSAPSTAVRLSASTVARSVDGVGSVQNDGVVRT